MKDVAAAAGVSIASVSRALNGDSSISPSLRAAVLRAVEQLQYRPSAAARRLRTRSSAVIGVVVQSVGDAYIGDVVLGIQERARRLGLQPLFFASEGREALEVEALEVFLSEQVQGLISVSPTGRPRALQRAVNEHLRVAVINWDVEIPERCLLDLEHGPTAASTCPLPESSLHASVRSVAFDDISGAQTATQHLVDLGHRRFVHFRGPSVRSSYLRLLGYRRALEAAKLWPQPVVVPESPVLGSREAAMTAFLRESRPPLAVVAYDDLAAVATLRAAHRCGWSVPADLSVVGIDDIQFAAYTNPALTTVAQPKQELGALSVDALLADGDEGTRSSVLEGRLVVRESTAPPSGRRPRPGTHDRDPGGKPGARRGREAGAQPSPRPSRRAHGRASAG
jgi:LacI family transcriptional regulator